MTSPNPPAASIRVDLPYHLRTLAGLEGPLLLSIPRPVTLNAVLDELEARYPMLRGTTRDHVTRARRPFLRFFAGQSDISLQPLDAPLPATVSDGTEPLTVLGAIAGG